MYDHADQSEQMFNKLGIKDW